MPGMQHQWQRQRRLLLVNLGPLQMAQILLHHCPQHWLAYRGAAVLLPLHQHSPVRHQPL
jgi:hypothetical protein